MMLLLSLNIQEKELYQSQAEIKELLREGRDIFVKELERDIWVKKDEDELEMFKIQEKYYNNKEK